MACRSLITADARAVVQTASLGSDRKGKTGVGPAPGGALRDCRRTLDPRGNVRRRCRKDKAASPAEVFAAAPTDYPASVARRGMALDTEPSDRRKALCCN